jgi:MFS family permease
MGLRLKHGLGPDHVAVFVVFALNGAAPGSWAPRMPALAEQIKATPGSLGLALFCGSAGLLISAALAGRLIEWIGARAALISSVIVASLVLPGVGFSGSVVMLGIALTAFGAAAAVWDVAMNMAAVNLERRTNKPIMPIFHAGFSFGGLGGSLGAGFAASQEWSPGQHLTVVAAVNLVILVGFARRVPTSRPSSEATIPTARKIPIRQPFLWLLAMVALCSAVAEGASSDWSALLMASQHGTSQGAAALTFGCFSVAMAATRLSGMWLQRRLGAARTLALGALLAAAGLLGAALITAPLAGYLGFALAGAGLAAAFPVALSLAGDAGKHENGSGGEREIAFVTTVAYTGFLAGPPAIGSIAQLTSLSTSFVVVSLFAALIAPAALGASRARSRQRVATSHLRNTV